MPSRVNDRRGRKPRCRPVRPAGFQSVLKHGVRRVQGICQFYHGRSGEYRSSLLDREIRGAVTSVGALRTRVTHPVFAADVGTVYSQCELHFTTSGAFVAGRLVERDVVEETQGVRDKFGDAPYPTNSPMLNHRVDHDLHLGGGRRANWASYLRYLSPSLLRIRINGSVRLRRSPTDSRPLTVKPNPLLWYWR